MKEAQFYCPYCGELNETDVHYSDGRSQTFISDCEVCCRPVEITVSFDNDGNVFVEIKNDEGF